MDVVVDFDADVGVSKPHTMRHLPAAGGRCLVDVNFNIDVDADIDVDVDVGDGADVDVVVIDC